MDRAEYAMEQRHQGYNCCQAVINAYAEELGMSDEQRFGMGIAFGGGMGGMEGNCGALCGAEMVLGLLDGSGRPIHAKARALYDLFRARCGSTICKELKGVETGQMLSSCDDCVRNAVRALEEVRGCST